MKIASLLKTFVFGLILSATGAAVLASPDPPPGVQEIVAQQSRLRDEAINGVGAFKDMPATERHALIQRQDRVLTILDGVANLDEMRPDERTAVLNDLEWIKATIGKLEDERIVCEYTRIAGSNRMKSVCMTAREQRELRENARESLLVRGKCSDPRGTCTNSGRR
jgi:hypothetical protein